MKNLKSEISLIKAKANLELSRFTGKIRFTFLFGKGGSFKTSPVIVEINFK